MEPESPKMVVDVLCVPSGIVAVFVTLPFVPIFHTTTPPLEVPPTIVEPDSATDVTRDKPEFVLSYFPICVASNGSSAARTPATHEIAKMNAKKSARVTNPEELPRLSRF